MKFVVHFDWNNDLEASSSAKVQDISQLITKIIKDIHYIEMRFQSLEQCQKNFNIVVWKHIDCLSS